MPSMSWSLTWSRWETSLLQKLSPGLQFYSAEDVPQTPPKAPNQTKRARSWYWWRHGAKASCKEEASSRPVGGSLVDSCADPASHHIEKEGVAVSARPSALSSLSFDWICKSLEPSVYGPTHASTQKYISSSWKSSCKLLSTGGRGDGGRVCGGPGFERFGSCSDGTVQGFDGVGEPDRFQLRRRFGDGVFIPVKQRILGACSTLEGAGSTQRHFLCQRPARDVSQFPDKCGGGAGGPRHNTWRGMEGLHPHQGCGHDHMASGKRDESHARGQPQGGYGCDQFAFVCLE